MMYDQISLRMRRDLKEVIERNEEKTITQDQMNLKMRRDLKEVIGIR